jgi:hypothetical protein
MKLFFFFSDNFGLTGSVADPDSLTPDPDPAFYLNSNPEPDMVSDLGLWWPKIKKKLLQLKKIHKDHPSYRRSLQPSKEIPNSDPDPLTWLNPDPIRIRNTTDRDPNTSQIRKRLFLVS